jgi:hypothetical protein
MAGDPALASAHIDYLLDGLKALGLLKARKARLFACGCFRLVWSDVRCPQVRVAVELTEGRADRQVSEQELQQHRYPTGGVPIDSLDHRLQIAVQSLVISNMKPGYVAWEVRTAADAPRYGPNRYSEGCRPQADLLRDIFGTPFRPPVLQPAWLTSTDISLARQMYDTRDFAAMPILADALQDAGCDGDGLLTHCRGPGPHVRGCHVADAVLGKK